MDDVGTGGWSPGWDPDLGIFMTLEADVVSLPDLASVCDL